MQCSECVNPVSLGRIAASLLALLRMLPLWAHADTRARVRRVARVGVCCMAGRYVYAACRRLRHVDRASNRFAHFLRHAARYPGAVNPLDGVVKQCPDDSGMCDGRTCCRELHRRALQSAQSRRVLRAAYSVAACCKLACCMLRAAKCALPVIRGMLHAAVCSSHATLHAALAHWHYQCGE